MDLEVKSELELGPSLKVGDRLIFVVSERLLINARKNHLIFGDVDFTDLRRNCRT